MKKKFNLENKKVLITGGALRIGKEICKSFAENGADVIIHCNNSIEEAEKLLKKLEEKTNGKHKIIKGDLLKTSFIEKIFHQNNDIDILINNASVFDNKPLEQENINTAKNQFNINFWAPFYLMQEFKKTEKKPKDIINILDYRINKNELKSGSYVLSKQALANLTKLAALQWAPEIKVNGIALGFVVPPSWLPQSKMKKSVKKTPLKKKVYLEEITEACLFIVKMQNITGEILYLDGGLHI